MAKQETENNTLPKHIAVIMDGNGRWAKKRNRPRVFGHRAGTKATINLVGTCNDMGVEILTVYVFSYENWRRPSMEVSALMRLLIEMVKQEINHLNEKNVRLNAIGNLDMLPKKTKEVLLQGIKETSKNTGLLLNLAISYSGREEILRATKNISADVKSGKINPEDISEELLSNYMYTADMPDPDLLIRTGGDQRISNYLLWQSAYTELYFTDILWPDFGEEELYNAIASYQKRERRFGKVIDKDNE